MHSQISASDKDFEPTFQKICSYVTRDIFMFVKEIQGSGEAYADEQVQKLLDEDDVLYPLREEQWLDSIFGANSRKPSDEWLEAVVSDGKWLF